MACFTSRFAIKARGHVASREELAGRPAFPGGGPFLRATHLNRPGKPLQPLSTRYIRHGRQAARQLGDMVLFWRRRRRPAVIYRNACKDNVLKSLKCPLAPPPPVSIVLLLPIGGRPSPSPAAAAAFIAQFGVPVASNHAGEFVRLHVRRSSLALGC